ncbi:hypothetical protein V8F20_005178 [Naviculisporaceae sp. PSN 640]
MASQWCPNDNFSPYTADSAKLRDLGTLSGPESERPHKMDFTEISRPKLTKVPPIPKISAQWDPRKGDSRTDWHKDCWKLETARPTARVDGWQEHYFRHWHQKRHIIHQVALDPLADGPYDEVVMDVHDRSIYDAYMLRADISRNENQFRRLQVVCRPLNDYVNRYVLFDRSGRVGLLGSCDSNTSKFLDGDMTRVIQEFRNLFRQYTGMEWKDRYRPQERPTKEYPSQYYTHVDLDYSREARDVPAFVQSQIQLPNYQRLNENLNWPVRVLMEVMLYGEPVESLSNPGVSIPGTNFSVFTAPYHTLSLRAIMAGFRTLKRIAAYLDEPRDPKDKNKPGGIRWKTILQASSRYRSEIPFCDGWYNSSRPVVISNYYTLFIELRFLSNLYPEAVTPDITALIDEISRRGSLQVWKHGHALTVHPLYQAYSSLPHGFQLLTDTSSVEFREIQAYLHNSCQQDAHRVRFEIQGIYRVFTKTKAKNPYHDWLRSTKEDQSPNRRNRLLLWHGTHISSLLSILETGLQIRKRFPPTPTPQPAPPLPALKRKRAGTTRKQVTRAGARKNSVPNIPAKPPALTSALYNPPLKPGVIQYAVPKPVAASARIGARLGGIHQRPRSAPLGSMFGDGIYLADASSKSAIYCRGGNPYWGPPKGFPLPPFLPLPGSAIPPPGLIGTVLFNSVMKRAETDDGIDAILLLCEADVGTKEERLRTVHSLPDGQEVIREFREREEKLKQGGIGKGVRCIEGVGRTGPRDTPDGWKKVPWNLGWDWNRSVDGNSGSDHRQQGHTSAGSDYGDVWMPDTSKPYGPVADHVYPILNFNEYVIYDPAHVQIRYILRVKIKKGY